MNEISTTQIPTGTQRTHNSRLAAARVAIGCRRVSRLGPHLHAYQQQRQHPRAEDHSSRHVGSGFLVQSYTVPRGARNQPVARISVLRSAAFPSTHQIDPSRNSEPRPSGCDEHPTTTGATHWCRQFGYDQYGNRAVIAESSLTAHATRPLAFSTTTNRVTDTGWGDADAGNDVEDLDSGTSAAAHLWQEKFISDEKLAKSTQAVQTLFSRFFSFQALAVAKTPPKKEKKTLRETITSVFKPKKEE